MKKNLGFVVGFIFGFFGFIMPSIAFSNILDKMVYFFAPFPLLMVFLGEVLFPTASLQTQANISFVLFPIGVLLNGLFFGVIGFLIGKYLQKKNKNEYIVIYIFASIILLFILIGVLECVVVPNCGA